MISPEIRAFAWAQFVAALIAHGMKPDAAILKADELIGDFDKRFPSREPYK